MLSDQPSCLVIDTSPVHCTLNWPWAEDIHGMLVDACSAVLPYMSILGEEVQLGETCPPVRPAAVEVGTKEKMNLFEVIAE